MFSDHFSVLGKDGVVSGSPQRETPVSFPNRFAEEDEPFHRIDLPDGTPVTQREDEDLQRRESVLTARIAQFETLVRKSKLTLSEKMEKVEKKEKEVEEKEGELSRREGTLAVRQEELNHREAGLRARLEELANSQAEYLDRAEDLLRQKEEFEEAQRKFDARTAAVLRQIAERKAELDSLLGRLH